MAWHSHAGFFKICHRVVYVLLMLTVFVTVFRWLLGMFPFDMTGDRNRDYCEESQNCKTKCLAEILWGSGHQYQ